MNIISSNSDSKIEQLKKRKKEMENSTKIFYSAVFGGLFYGWIFCIELLDLNLKNEINEEKTRIIRGLL